MDVECADTNKRKCQSCVETQCAWIWESLTHVPNRDRADRLRPSFPYAVIGVPTLTNTLGSTSAFPTASANTVCSELSSTSSFSEYHTAPSATAKPAAMITVYPPASALETGFSGIHLSVISSYRSPRDARCTSEVPPESAALDFFAALEVLPVWRPRGGEKPAAAANPRGTGLGNRIGPTPGVPRLKGTARHAWRAAAGENDALVDTARVATRATRWCPPSKRARRDDAVDIACAGGGVTQTKEGRIAIDCFFVFTFFLPDNPNLTFIQIWLHREAALREVSMFLNGAADKLKREQEQRKAELQRRHASEQRAAAVAETAARARDDLEKAERHELRMREAEERVVLERIMANNEGVSWEARLSGVRSDAAVVKGIRNRADDKVTLPQSSWRALQNAGAASAERGHLFFEIAVVDGAEDGATKNTIRTHAAVLGFDGVEGEVGLPSSLLAQLGVGTSLLARGDKKQNEEETTDETMLDADADAFASAFGASSSTDVLVSYRRLPKGTHCVLQPLDQSFQHELAVAEGVDLRSLLETAMTKRCTLTVGDDVFVTSSENKTYALKCVAVTPDDASAVSLMETDIEVDIAPSEDYENAMRLLAENAQKRLAAAALAADALNDAKQQKDREAGVAAAEATANTLAQAEAKDRQARFQASCAKSLPPEPSVGAMNSDEIVSARFTFPNGTTKTRRFFKTDLLATAFDFVRAEGGAGETVAFNLVTRYPRVVVAEKDNSEGGTFSAQIGSSEKFLSAVAGGGALFVERITNKSDA